MQSGLDERSLAPLGVLALGAWIGSVVRAWGFLHTNAVVTLRQRGEPPPFQPPLSLRLRDATRDDLPLIAAVDAAAFEPLWRHDTTDLQYAQAAAATFSVAELEGRIVGYQLSTQHGLSGHLARLAVDPGVQKRGVGRSLVAAALGYFHRLGIREVTVNTQHNNQASQSLYQRMGFRYTRQCVPVWTFDGPRA
jgi:GNAT superfamily N-acetyltransferase